MKLYSGLDNAPVENYFDWSVQGIRERPNLGDLSIAIRNQVPYGNPNMLFNIFIQNGIVKTAIRKYPDYFDKKWIDKFEVGTGTACAIAFDGNWKLYNGKWRYVTNEFPHIFWVDNEGKLYVQLWDDVDSKFELAQNATKVKAIRAWKNVSFTLKDQGLVAAYIKTDGKVYYRNYAYQLTEEYAWENERELEEFTGIAVNLNMFITNDYRMGFVVEDNLGKIHWIITTRNWAGMAIAADTLTVAPATLEVDLIPIEYYEGFEYELLTIAPAELGVDLRCALTHNDFFEIYNEPITVLNEELEEYEDWGKVIIFTTDHRLYNISASSFELVGSSTSYYPDTIQEIGYKTYKITFEGDNNFNNAGENPTLKYNQGQTVNGVGVVYDIFEKQFDAINLVPTAIPLPEVEVIYNE